MGSPVCRSLGVLDLLNSEQLGHIDHVVLLEVARRLLEDGLVADGHDLVGIDLHDFFGCRRKDYYKYIDDVPD